MTIVLAVHGTRSVAGQATAHQIAEAVGRLSGRRVRIGWIDLLEPTLTDVLDSPGTPVVVPWLIGGGYHLLNDVQKVVSEVNPDALVSSPLGDSPALVEALIHNLKQLNPAPGPVALTWAGSSAVAAHRRVALISERLSTATGRMVVPVPMTAYRVPPEEALARLRAESDAAPVVLPLLLAPGFFHDRVRGLATVVGDPIGAHPAVVAWAASCGDLLGCQPVSPVGPAQ